MLQQMRSPTVCRQRAQSELAGRAASRRTERGGFRRCGEQDAELNQVQISRRSVSATGQLVLVSAGIFAACHQGETSL